MIKNYIFNQIVVSMKMLETGIKKAEHHLLRFFYSVANISFSK